MKYTVEVKPSHKNWGMVRNPTNRTPREGESYVKIPSKFAKKFDIVRDKEYVAHFTNGMKPIKIKAAGNGPKVGKIQYAKQFEGIGKGACSAFTPWYQKEKIEVRDEIVVEFLDDTNILFYKK